jgi:hypothetical protein
LATKYVKGKIYPLDLATLRSAPGQSRKFMDPSGLAEMMTEFNYTQLPSDNFHCGVRRNRISSLLKRPAKEGIC